MAKIPAALIKPIKLLDKVRGSELDTGNIRMASFVMAIGVLQIYLAYVYGTPIAASLFDNSKTLSQAMWIIRVSGFLSAFTAVLGFITADKEKMLDAQLVLGLLQLFLLNCCISLHWGVALVGGLIPYVSSVMFINAAEHRRSMIEAAEEKKSNTKVYTGCVLELVLILPLGFLLSNMLAIYSHSFFVQKAMVTFGMMLYIYTAVVASLGFYLGDRKEMQLVYKLMVGIHCVLFVAALLAAWALYSSMDQTEMLISVGILAIGIGINLLGVWEWREK